MGQFVWRPGMIAIILFSAGIGILILSWTGNIFDSVGQKQVDESKNVVKCGTLNVYFSDKRLGENASGVSVSVDEDVEALAVTFSGSENFSRVVDDPESGKVYDLEVESGRVDDVKAKVKGCDRVFRP